MTTSRLPVVLYDGRACGGSGSCFAARLARIGYSLVVLDDLEGDVEFVGDLVVVAFVHGFGCLVFDRVDKLQWGFASRPAFQTRAVNAVPGGVGVLPADELRTRVQRFRQ